jgi:hypothetical protein
MSVQVVMRSNAVVLDERDSLLHPARVPIGGAATFVVAVDCAQAQPALEVGALPWPPAGLAPGAATASVPPSAVPSAELKSLRQHFGPSYCLPPLAPGVHRVSVCSTHGLITLLGPVEAVQTAQWAFAPAVGSAADGAAPNGAVGTSADLRGVASSGTFVGATSPGAVVRGGAPGVEPLSFTSNTSILTPKQSNSTAGAAAASGSEPPSVRLLLRAVAPSVGVRVLAVETGALAALGGTWGADGRPACRCSAPVGTGYAPVAQSCAALSLTGPGTEPQ